MGVPNPLLELVDLVARMRAAQRSYFKSRTSEDLKSSLRLESDVDQAIHALRRQHTARPFRLSRAAQAVGLWDSDERIPLPDPGRNGGDSNP